MTEVVQTPLWIDLIAAVVGGLAGATVAAQKRMDITGVVGLAPQPFDATQRVREVVERLRARDE